MIEAMRPDVPWLVLLVAGGLLSRMVGQVGRASKSPTGPEDFAELRRALTDLDRRVEEEASANNNRFELLEARLAEVAAKLAAIPATEQIVTAVEQALMRGLGPVEQRLAAQEQSIGVLKNAVGETDALIERLAEMAKNTLAHRSSA